MLIVRVSGEDYREYRVPTKLAQRRTATALKPFLTLCRG
jgi:hypothetical protein